MNKNILWLLILLICFTFTLQGCNDEEQQEAYEIVDCAGYTYKFNEKVDSIACVWPSGSQLLISMGMGDTLVGVAENTKKQPWAHALYPKLKDVPGLNQYESAESLLTLNADIVLTSEANVAEELRGKGVPAITICYYSIADMKYAMNMMSKLLDDKYSSKFIDYIAYIEGNIKLVSDCLEGKVTTKKSIYYINGNNDNGLYKTAGGGTMNEEWAKNAYCDFATASLLSSNESKVDKEAILSKNPDVVIIGGRYQHRLETVLKSSEEWASINAVLNEEVYKAPLGISPFDRFGIEISMMIPWVASQVYSEYFEYDIEQAIIDFYIKFAGITLTSEQANYIIEGRQPDGTFEIQ